MLRVTLLAFAVVLSAAADLSAQTVRFRTSVGAFDMLLNPTGNADLQPLVDNMLANVAAGIYRDTVVNRAPQGFVLQIGSFDSDTRDVNDIGFGGFDSVDSFDPVIVDADNDGVVDFDTTGLTNTRGTVSLALSAAGPNSGSSSFFVNVGDNSFLDAQGFVPFATVSDLTTVERITNGTQVDISNQVGQPGSLAFIDVPLTADGELIMLETVSVVSESSFSFVGPLKTALAGDSLTATVPTSAASLGGDGAAASLTSPGFVEEQPAAAAVPEPTTLLLLLGAVGVAATRRR